MSRQWKRALSCAALVSLSALLPASAAAHPPGRDLDEAKEVRAVRRQGEVRVDGRLDEGAWEKAEAVEDLVERKPRLRGVPGERTVMLILVDRDALYIGVRCYDRSPNEVRARTLTRDSFAVFSDDAVSVKIDAGHDHRTTLGFVLNPAGARLDYRGLDESSFKSEFDAVWEGAAARTAEGWSAEIRIPFSELGLSKAELPERIGFNLTRDHNRSNATYDWSLSPPPYGPIAASRYGHLVGLDAGRGAQESATPGEAKGSGSSWAVAPYLLGGFERSRPEADAEPENDLLADAGLDAEIRYGARGRAQLTVNTDFAQVDLDDQVVNLGRFSLFLPEKRDFFLEDAEAFSFGRPESAQAFHSRRIGLDRRSTVPILAGAKIVDRPAPGLQLGVLDVVTRPAGDLPWTSHLVSRGQLQLGDGSHAGAVVTHRQSLDHGGDRNLVAGFDGALRGTRSPLLVEAFALVSHTAEESRGGTADVADTMGSEPSTRTSKGAPGTSSPFS